jgi:hypothetical protein
MGVPNMGILRSEDGQDGYYARAKTAMSDAASGVGNGMANGLSGAVNLVNPASYMNRGGRRTRRRGRRAGRYGENPGPSRYAADDDGAYY